MFLANEILKCRGHIETLKEQILTLTPTEISDFDQLDDSQLAHSLSALESSVKELEKVKEQELEGAKTKVETLKSFMVRSLKNQLNEDNKKSQALIAKVKKNYEELQKMYEALVQKHNTAQAQLK